jgi:hypothetical protein
MVRHSKGKFPNAKDTHFPRSRHGLFFGGFAEAQSVHRDWVGELKIGEIKHFVALEIASDHEPMTGTVVRNGAVGNRHVLVVVLFRLRALHRAIKMT